MPRRSADAGEVWDHWRHGVRTLAFGLLCAFLFALTLVPQPLWLAWLPGLRWGSGALMLLVSLSLWPRLPWDRTDWPVLLWTLATLPCVLLAEQPAAAWSGQGVGWVGYREVILLGVAWYTIAKHTFTVRRWHWMAWSLIIGTGIAAGLGYVEAATHHNPLYERWGVDNGRYALYQQQHRIMSTQFHPTVLGTLLAVLGVPVVLQRAAAARGAIRWSWGLLAIGLAGAIALTKTRTSLAILGAAVSLLALLLRQRRWLIGVALLLAAGITYGAMIDRNARWRFSGEGLRRASVRRLDHAALSLEMTRQHPWCGVGFNHYRYLYDRYRSADAYAYDLKIPDQMYLTLLAETGLLGAAAFALLVSTTLRRWETTLRAQRALTARGPVAALGVGWLALLAHGLSYETLFWTMPLAVFWIWLGFLHGPMLDPPRRRLGASRP